MRITAATCLLLAMATMTLAADDPWQRELADLQRLMDDVQRTLAEVQAQTAAVKAAAQQPPPPSQPPSPQPAAPPTATPPPLLLRLLETQQQIIDRLDRMDQRLDEIDQRQRSIALEQFGRTTVDLNRHRVIEPPPDPPVALGYTAPAPGYIIGRSPVDAGEGAWHDVRPLGYPRALAADRYAYPWHWRPYARSWWGYPSYHPHAWPRYPVGSGTGWSLRLNQGGLSGWIHW